MATSSEKKTNWALMAFIYVAASLVLATGGRLLHGLSIAAAFQHVVHDALILAVIAGIILGGLYVFLEKKTKHAHKAMGKVIRHHVFLAAVGVWCGIGLAAYASAALLLAHPPVSLLASAAGGFAALPTLLGPQSSPGAAPLFLVWSAGCGVALHHRRKQFRGKPAKLIKEHLDKKTPDRAPDKAPAGAHFFETTKKLHGMVIADDRLDNRIVLAQADLADDWGEVKKKRWLAAPEEGSVLLIGSAGGGKGLILVRFLLNLVKANRDKNERPTKIIASSTMLHSFAQPTAAWLKSQGFKARMLDLTQAATESDGYGALVRWSPNQLIHGWDTANKTAKDVAKAVRDPNDRERHEFFEQQVQAILAPAFYAAVLDGQDYGVALKWATRFSDPEFTDVTRVLKANIGKNLDADFDDCEEALRVWQATRKFLFDLAEKEDGEFEWKTSHGASSSNVTGQGIMGSLNGKLLDIASERARKATASPNFDHEQWLEEEGTSVLYLVATTHEPVMTKSLFVPMVHRLIQDAMRRANATKANELPYRLVIVLDELTNSAPIPDLHSFFAQARQFGIQIIASAQSIPQIEEQYNPHVAGVLLDNAAVVMFLAGIKDSTTVMKLSTVGGSRIEEVTSATKGKGDHSSETISEQMRALIDGGVISGLSKPKPKEHEPGEGLFVTDGGIARVEIEPWFFQEPFCHRGTPHPNQTRAKLHLDYLESLEKSAGRRMKRWLAEHRPQVSVTTAAAAAKAQKAIKTYHPPQEAPPSVAPPPAPAASTPPLPSIPPAARLPMVGAPAETTPVHPAVAPHPAPAASTPPLPSIPPTARRPLVEGTVETATTVGPAVAAASTPAATTCAHAAPVADPETGTVACHDCGEIVGKLPPSSNMSDPAPHETPLERDDTPPPCDHIVTTTNPATGVVECADCRETLGDLPPLLAKHTAATKSPTVAAPVPRKASPAKKAPAKPIQVQAQPPDDDAPAVTFAKGKSGGWTVRGPADQIPEPGQVVTVHKKDGTTTEVTAEAIQRETTIGGTPCREATFTKGKPESSAKEALEATPKTRRRTKKPTVAPNQPPLNFDAA